VSSGLQITSQHAAQAVLELRCALILQAVALAAHVQQGTGACADMPCNPSKGGHAIQSYQAILARGGMPCSPSMDWARSKHRAQSRYRAQSRHWVQRRAGAGCSAEQALGAAQSRRSVQGRAGTGCSAEQALGVGQGRNWVQRRAQVQMRRTAPRHVRKQQGAPINPTCPPACPPGATLPSRASGHTAMPKRCQRDPTRGHSE